MEQELIAIVDGIPTFSPYAKTIEDFKILVTRDRGGKVPGDFDGRKKLMATKELAYVYWIASSKSEFVNNFPEHQRHDKIVAKLAMPEGWKPDGHVQNAIETFKELTATQTSKVLEEMKDSLFSCQSLITLVRKRMDSRLTQLTLDETLIETQPELLDKIQNDVNKLLDLSKKIPEMITVIEKLQEKVAKEKADGKGRGGKEVNLFQHRKSNR